MAVDLSKTDDFFEGENAHVDDKHVELTLKVLRTIRNHALNLGDFNTSVILSHAHERVVEYVQNAERETNISERGETVE